ncbi:hypothetical protein MAJ_11359, partial [Metarhizium majus ARSEF 297]
MVRTRAQVRASISAESCITGTTTIQDSQSFNIDSTRTRTPQPPIVEVVRPLKRQRDDLPDQRPQTAKRARLSSGVSKPTSLQSAPGVNRIEYWVDEGYWPESNRKESNCKMHRLLVKKKSSSSIRSRKRCTPGSASSVASDQRPREEKSAPYSEPRYNKLLESEGSFMYRSKLGISEQCKSLCQDLLKIRQLPAGSLFRDEVFEATCHKVADRNEARVMHDIRPLIVPSAETLAINGAGHLECLIESINEGWNNCIRLTAKRPQPDFSVGFQRSAFSQDQLVILSPFLGEPIAGDQNYFMATYLMYFPFLTCEVKCGTAALDVADRQNAHSATIAARAVVKLFQLVHRESELHRRILAFSFSHDHQSVRIYGHYAEISVDENETKYYRHTIRKFDFTELEGKEKQTAYSFTTNIYDKWMPMHFKRICSAINQLPGDADLDGSSVLESGLSQDLASSCLTQSDVESRIDHDRRDGEEFTERGAVKRARRGQTKTLPNEISGSVI